MTPDAFTNSQQRRINDSLTQKSNDVLQSFMSNSSRASSLTHVTSCINGPITTTTTSANGNNGNSNSNVNQLATIASIASTPPTTMVFGTGVKQQQSDDYKQITATSSGAVTPKNEDDIVLSQRRLSSCSSSSTTPSSQSTDSSSEAADKEIEAIALPNIIGGGEQLHQQQPQPFTTSETTNTHTPGKFCWIESQFVVKQR